MYISHVHRYIYLAPVRTGTTSITKVLEEQFDGQLYTDRYFGIDPYYRHDIGVPAEYENYFIWASVRNPFARAVSAYNWANRSQINPIPIQETMTDPPLLQSLCGVLFENPVLEGCVPVRLDAYVKLEHLEEDFSKLPFARSVNFPYENSSPSIIKELDYNGIAYVQRHYQKDFDYFDYDKLDFFKLYL